MKTASHRSIEPSKTCELATLSILLGLQIKLSRGLNARSTNSSFSSELSATPTPFENALNPKSRSPQFVDFVYYIVWISTFGTQTPFWWIFWRKDFSTCGPPSGLNSKGPEYFRKVLPRWINIGEKGQLLEQKKRKTTLAIFPVNGKSAEYVESTHAKVILRDFFQVFQQTPEGISRP